MPTASVGVVCLAVWALGGASVGGYSAFHAVFIPTRHMQNRSFFERVINPFNYSGKERTTSIFIVVVIFFFLIKGLTDKDKKGQGQTRQVAEKPKPLGEGFIKVGQRQHVGFFYVTVNGWSVRDDVPTGNLYTSVTPRAGVKFVVLGVSFKNNDDQVRQIDGCGEIEINYRGRELTVDKAEPLLADGYGVSLEPVSQMVTHRTVLVFPVAEEVRGPLYWTPEDGEKVYLGEL